MDPTVIIGGVILGLGLLLYKYISGAKRNQDLMLAAKSMGYSFEDKPPLTSVTNGARLRLFSLGRDREAKNVMTRQVGDTTERIFDFHYTEGSLGKSVTVGQTVYMLTSENLHHLPYLNLDKKGGLARLGKFSPYPKFEHQAYPEFNKLYTIRTKDADKLKDVFDPAAIQHLTQNPGWRVESMPGMIIIFRFEKRTPPNQWPTFLKSAQQMAKVLAVKR